MKAMATFIMRGRAQAAMTATVFAVLSLILAPLSYISAAVIALVTLRKGAYDGLYISFIAALVMAVLAYVMLGSGVIALLFVVVVWMPVWALAVVLRRTMHLPWSIYIAAGMACIVPIVVHWMLHDPVAWWLEQLGNIFQQTMRESAVSADPNDVQLMLEILASSMTGMVAGAVFVSLICSLFLGRWWQAALYNPGGFREEFVSLKMDRRVAIVALTIIVLAMIISQQGELFSDLTFVVITGCGLFGLAMVHDWVEKTRANTAWLVAIYIMLFIVAKPVMVLLALIAISDAWMDYRRYFVKPDKMDS